MSNSDWMSYVLDNTSITDMCIPGTHDSGAYEYCVTPMCRAHDKSISEQLDIGVRAFDIRVGRSSADYWVYHGPIGFNVTIQSVLDDINDFLKANPSEFVILMLKQETGRNDISNGLNALVNRTLGARQYKCTNTMKAWPKLKDVRGKVLVFSRLGTVGAGSFNTQDWSDNPVKKFVPVNGQSGFGMILQDLYKSPKVVDKQKAITENLRRGYESDNEGLLFVNFTSFVWKPYEPLVTGKDPMKPWLVRQLVGQPGRGVVCVDAVDQDVTTAIASNNPKRSGPVKIPVPHRTSDEQTLRDIFATYRRKVYGED